MTTADDEEKAMKLHKDTTIPDHLFLPIETIRSAP